LIGSRVVLASNITIGSPGFSFVPCPTGLLRVPQLGRVIVEDDVEFGANCAIDRGAIGDTVIGRGTMFDNLVHIAHNVRDRQMLSDRRPSRHCGQQHDRRLRDDGWPGRHQKIILR